MKDYLTMEPVWGPCQVPASDLDGKKLRWKLPNSQVEIDEAAGSQMFASADDNGNVSVAIRDEVDGPHRGPDGKPIPITVFGVWLTPEALGLVRKDTGGGADYEAIAG